MLQMEAILVISSRGFFCQTTHHIVLLMNGGSPDLFTINLPGSGRFRTGG